MIVEDELIIAADLKDRLTELGYEVGAVCHSGEDAIEVFAEVKPALVLMDVNLAGKLDGVETAMKLRESGNTRLIFLTSNSDDKTFTRAQAAQPQAFLSKPFRGRDLKHAIKLALGEDSPASSGPAPAEPEAGTVFEDRIFVMHRDRLVRLLLEDVYWFEADNYYAKAITAERDYLVTKTLKKVSTQLPLVSDFFRVNRSYLINLRQVTEIGEVKLFFGEKEITVNKSGRDKVLRRLNNL